MHTLVLYGRRSKRADATLRELARRARSEGGLLTVLALVRHEDERTARCCDTRSALWNEICRDLATEDLAHARLAVEADEDVELGTIEVRPGRAPQALTAEALARGADEIVLADPSQSGLGRLERRRLERGSPLPVS